MNKYFAMKNKTKNNTIISTDLTSQILETLCVLVKTG